MNLRPYQVDAVNAVCGGFRGGVKRQLLILPTGCGKTVVFCTVAKNCKSGRVLILAHRGELIDQAREKFSSITGITPAREQGAEHAGDACIVVGSVQTIQGERLESFPADWFRLIIIDEAHHTLAPSYMRIIDHFRDALLLGVTATADRGDKRSLAEVYERVAYEMNIKDAVFGGWLARPVVQTLPIRIELKKPKQGDWSDGECASAIEPYLEDIAVRLSQVANDRKTVVFLPLISTAQRFRDLCVENGLEAREVNGQSKDRAEVLEWFHNAGAGSVLCNSMLLTEGWDEPSLDCVVVLRPTKIRALYVQMVGRGTRLYDGKKDLLILDFLWMTEIHSLIRPAAMVAKNPGLAGRISELMADRTGERADLIGTAEDAEEDAAREERERSLAEKLDAMKARESQTIDPLAFLESAGIRTSFNPDGKDIFQLLPPTEKQVEYLEKNGIDAGAIEYRGQAGEIIFQICERSRLGLATPKQVRLLERRGFVHVGEWTIKQANKMIGMMANNRWRVPFGIVPNAYKPEKEEQK